jgi:hypothetical protein
MRIRMNADNRDAIEREIGLLVPGSQLKVIYERCRFLVMITNEQGIHTGRPRYLVACTKCEKLLHEATTGPIENIERHVNEPGSTSSWDADGSPP